MAAIILVLAGVAISEGVERRRRAKLAKRQADDERYQELQQRQQQQQESYGQTINKHLSSREVEFAEEGEGAEEFKLSEHDDAESSSGVSSLVDEKHSGPRQFSSDFFDRGKTKEKPRNKERPKKGGFNALLQKFV